MSREICCRSKARSVRSGEMFERIELFSSTIGGAGPQYDKIRRTRHSRTGWKSRRFVRRLDGLLGRGRHPTATIEWSLEPLRSPWSEFHHAPSREPRKPLIAQPLADRPTDPLYELRKQLRLQYIARISPGPAKVRNFLENTCLRPAPRRPAFFSLETVDDFLAFDAARRFALDRGGAAGASTVFRARVRTGLAAARQRMVALLQLRRQAARPRRSEAEACLVNSKPLNARLGMEKASDLRKAIHFLLRRQFVFAGDPRTGTVFNILMDSRFKSVIDGFFDSCGVPGPSRCRSSVGGHNRLGRGRSATQDEARRNDRYSCAGCPLAGRSQRRAVEDRAIVITTLKHSLRPLQGYGPVQRFKFDIFDKIQGKS